MLQDVLIYVKNVTGAQINKGKVVRISGATGDNALIATASYESDGVSANTLGITNQDIPNDSFGYVITEGTLVGINTNTFSAGQLLYLGATGSIIGTAPVAPLHAVRLGQVLRVQTNNGSIYVRIDNGYELGELHDVVDTTTTSSYGDLLIKSGSIWINSKQLTGSYGLTGSLNATSFTGSLQGTASFASNTLIATSASYAATASYADNFIVKNTLTAQTLIVSTVSSSVVYSSGSNIFGNSISNTQTFTGSVLITGSQNITGSLTVGFGGSKELEVLPTGITAGNLITDTHRFTGSLLVTGSNNTIKGDTTIIQSGPGTYIEVTDGRIFLSDKTVITQSLAVGNITASIVSGRIDASNDVVAFSTSDKHLKENIQPIENALDKLDNIGGYTFDWNNQIEIHGYEGHDIGVIAQEIESILPEVVTTRDNGYKAVKYEKIVPFLIQCIKELKDEIRDLKSQK
jgi:hypothetical protein